VQLLNAVPSHNTLINGDRMEDLLNHPAIQAGIAPFAVALAVAALAFRSRLLGLALGAAFATMVALALGFSVDPLTSMRKMVLVGLAAGVLVLPLELTSVQPVPRVRAALAAAAGLAGVWVVWRVLQQREIGPAIGGGAAAAVYMAAMVESGFSVRDDAVRSSSAALMLGLGMGVLALLAPSVTLMLVGVAMGAGAGAALLLQMVTGRRAPPGWTLTLPATVVVGLVGLLSVLTSGLQWYQLLPLLAVPWATLLVPAERGPVWRTALLTSFVAFVPVALAVAMVWLA
jgi:hypothetical protein